MLKVLISLTWLLLHDVICLCCECDESHPLSDLNWWKKQLMTDKSIFQDWNLHEMFEEVSAYLVFDLEHLKLSWIWGSLLQTLVAAAENSIRLVCLLQDVKELDPNSDLPLKICNF